MFHFYDASNHGHRMAGVSSPAKLDCEMMMRPFSSGVKPSAGFVKPSSPTGNCEGIFEDIGEQRCPIMTLTAGAYPAKLVLIARSLGISRSIRSVAGFLQLRTTPLTSRSRIRRAYTRGVPVLEPVRASTPPANGSRGRCGSGAEDVSNNPIDSQLMESFLIMTECRDSPCHPLLD